MSLFGHIWNRHTTGRIQGHHHELSVDLLYGHEGTIALILPQLEALSTEQLNPERLFWVADHFAPPSSAIFADALKSYFDFGKRHGIPIARFEGIGHRLMLESDRVSPGMFVIGADSHTTTIGGKGALGIGLGSTDVLATIQTGTVWLEPPTLATIRLTGAFATWVEAKDLVLELLRRYSQSGFLGQVIEFRDETDQGLPLESRAVLTNMSVEMGAVSALVSDKTSPSDTPPGATSQTITIALDTIQPLVALPGSPDHVVPIAELTHEITVDTVHIGSCASGGWSDIKTVSELLKTAPRNPHTSLLVTPATQQILRKISERRVMNTLIDGGATVLNPSCGACGGIDKGIPAKGETAITTGPRNYSSRARVGSQVYLVSTATAAASSITGHISAATEVMP